MSPDSIQEIIARQIRALRKARGWSLSQVESMSRGSISAVALGSYERCDRAISVRKLVEIAQFFDVPLTHLLGQAKRVTGPDQITPLVIDLRRMKAVSKNLNARGDATLIALTTLVTSIAHRRGDWNAEVMSLRQSDLSTLSLMTMISEEEVKQSLNTMKLLLTGPNHP